MMLSISGPRGTERLTRNEIAIVSTLAQQVGRTVPRSRIYAELWGDHPPANPAVSLRVHTNLLRDKFERLGLSRAAIQTVKGHGMRMNEIPGRSHA